MKKYIVGGGAVIVTLWQVDAEDNNVVEVEASPDQNIAAFFCDNSEQVYLVSANVLFDLNTILNYTAPISTIRWRDSTNQLAIAGGDSSSTAFFLLYDYTEQTEQDLSSITNDLVLDLAFSSDGTTLYYIVDPPTNVIYVYNMSTQTASNLTAAGAQVGFSGVSVAGNFVSAWNIGNVFVWNRLTAVFYGQYDSTLTSSGLSPDGSNLVTLTKSS
jgi:WD40 repeat protein